MSIGIYDLYDNIFESKEIYDHFGNSFESEEAMCNYWNTDSSLYNIRRQEGWSLEEALTGKKRERISKNKVYDHLGNEFNSIESMCSFWNIPSGTYRMRIKRGWSQEEALTGKKDKVYNHLGNKFNSNKVYDHLGNEFNSIKSMCKYWNIAADSTYRTRIKRGWTIEEALTGNKEREKVYDHLGTEFNSIESMCSFWNIADSTYRMRIKKGWSQEEALTDKKRVRLSKNKVYDHLGNKFNSIRSMCNHWNIYESLYRHRIKQLGWSQEEALTGIRNK